MSGPEDRAFSFAVLDVETTGLRPPGAAITEIAALKLDCGRVTDAFHSLVDPLRPIPRFIQRLTGITDEMVVGQPTIEQVLPRLASFLGSRVAVAHNAAFDFGFLDYEARRLLGIPLPQRRLCTVRLARRALPNLRSRSLDCLIRHLGIECGGRHRALADARATAEVLLALLAELERSAEGVLAGLIESPTAKPIRWLPLSRRYASYGRRR